MFVGHALFAFAVAGLVADWRGWPRRSALLVAVLAGAFATLPDVDVAYALTGLGEWLLTDSTATAPTAFWDASRGVHRSVTHSLLLGALAAPAFGLVALAAQARGRNGSRRSRFAAPAALALFGVLLLVALARDGPLAAFVLSLFLACGALVALVAVRVSAFERTLPPSPSSTSSTPLSPATITLAALWGLWSHPWGDLVTGSPPDWLFPADPPVLASRIVLHPDPTLHLLAAFAIELGVIWLAALTFCRLTDRGAFDAIDPRASLAAGYGLVALAATPPTLAVSYHFVFSILGVGLLCGLTLGPPSPALDRPRLRRPPLTGSLLETALTGLVAVTSALVAYVAVYGFVGPI